MPLVSVIIPTYNRDYLIGESIQSVLDQTFPDFELFVIDDGSTDHTSEVVRSFSDSRLKYILQENRGPAAARNMGLKAAHSEFITFLDSDDLFIKNKINRQLTFLKQSPEIGLCFTAYTKIIEFGTIDPITHGRRTDPVVLEELLMGPAFTFSSVMLRKGWVDQVGLLDETLSTGEEWQWLIRIILVGCQMAGLTEPLVVKRIHSQNLIRFPERNEVSGIKAINSVFNLPDFPSELQCLYPVAMANHFARLSGLACINNDIDQSALFASKALQELEHFSDQEKDDIAMKIVHIARGLSINDPREMLFDLSDHLTAKRGDLAMFSKALRAAWYATETYDCFCTQNRSGVINNSLHYLMVTFPRPKNRGVSSMLLRSLVGEF